MQRVGNGEVSPYLVDDMLIGDQLELRGPFGGWFAWRADAAQAILLVAGGSGDVPLMSMMRERARLNVDIPFRLVYSVRTPDDRSGGGQMIIQRRVRPASPRSWSVQRLMNDQS